MSNVRVAINVTSENKNLIENVIKKNKILGFDQLDNKHLYFFAVSLGLNKNIDNVDTKGASSWVRTETINTQKEETYIRLCLLGKASEEEVEDFIDLDKNFRESELYAHVGFGILKDKIEHAQNDNELFSKMLMSDLDRLYTAYKLNK